MKAQTFYKTLALLGLCTSGILSADEPQSNEKKQPEKDPHLEAMLLGNRDYYPQTWMEKGRVLYLSQNYAEAIQAFFKATRISPEEAAVWFNLGLSYYKNRQFDEALISFLEAYRLKNEEKYLYHASLSYFKAGEIHQAIIHLRTLLGNNPKHGYAWKLLAQSYEHLEQFPEAKSAYLKAYEILPEDGEVIYALDKLIDHQSKDLSMPNAYDAEVTSVTPTNENFTAELPMSRLIDVTAPEYVAPTQTGLLPLSESYHLNFDAPQKHNFKPSEEKNWNPKSEPETTPRPAPKVTPQKPARTFEDL